MPGRENNACIVSLEKNGGREKKKKKEIWKMTSLWKGAEEKRK